MRRQRNNDCSAKTGGTTRPVAAPATLGHALRELLEALLDAVRRNEAGVLADAGPECLHDFRVALRKMRVALAELRAVFPAGRAGRFRRRFAELGELTNQLRDCDVLLARKTRFLKLAPPDLRPKLRAFFKACQQRRRRQLLALTNLIGSPKYARLMAEWQDWLHEEAVFAATAPAQTAVLPGVAGIILRRLDKVIAGGLAITPDTADAELHKVRIQCKKLRYLLDFFQAELPAGKVRGTLDKLKRLQTELGNFNDLAAQLAMLKKYRRGTARHSAENAAVNALIDALTQEKIRVRASVQIAFNKFSAPAANLSLKSLLNAEKNKRSMAC